jgi:hypothetical protein
LATYTPSVVPRHADPAERVADHEVAAVVGQAAQSQATVLDPHLEQRPGPQRQPLAVDRDDAGVDLGDEAVGPGTHVGEVPREGQPAAPEVVGTQRLARRVRRIGHRRDRADVGEHEQRRVVEVDVGVPQRVQDQRPARLVRGVVHDQHAVVRRLGVAPPWRHRQGQPPGHHADDGPGRTPPAAQPPRHQRAAGHQDGSQADQDAAHRHAGDQHEAGQDRTEDRADRTDTREAAHDGAGLVEVRQQQLGDDRGDGREHRPWHQDRERGDQRQQLRRDLGDAPDDRRREGHDHARHPQQRARQAPRVAPVGRPSTAPRAEGDRSERDADHQRAGLEGETEVRRQQSQHGQLDHEDGRGRAEDQRRGHPVTQRGRAVPGSHVVSGSW